MSTIKRSVQVGCSSECRESASPYQRVALLLPGLYSVLPLAAVAWLLGQILPEIGAPVFAVVGGFLVSAFRRPAAAIYPGISFASKTVLQASIVVLGTGLSLHQVADTGASSLPVLLGTLIVALAGASLVGRAMSIKRDLRTLIGVGTGICGASAVAATDAVIGASEADVSYAIATIFTFNLLAVLTFPSIGHLLGMAPRSFGLWAGTAVNDMSSVVAAASIFGHGATSSAVVVKLTRTIMIIPISLGLALWRARRLEPAVKGGVRPSVGAHVLRALPTFIGWFLVAVTLNTIGLVPSSWHSLLARAAQAMITIALAAIGRSTHAGDIRRAGITPLALGGILWVLVGTTSLGLQAAMGSVR